MWIYVHHDVQYLLEKMDEYIYIDIYISNSNTYNSLSNDFLQKTLPKFSFRLIYLISIFQFFNFFKKNITTLKFLLHTSKTFQEVSSIQIFNLVNYPFKQGIQN